MANKNVYMTIGETLSSFQDYNNWRKFLECSGWNFKYNWTQQVLIYAQKPDSRACATQEVWAERLGRFVKKDARVISILDDSSNSLKLTNIIDVSDTASPSGKELQLWSFSEESREYMLKYLSEGYMIPLLENGESDAAQLAHIISDVVDANISNSSYLTDNFKHFIRNSVICQVFSRCEMSQYFNAESLENGIANIPDDETLTVLGNRIQSISKEFLLEINKGVKEYNKQKLLNYYKEEKENGEQHSIQSERRLSDSEHRTSADTGTEEIRNDEKNISSGRETGTIYNSSDQGNSLGRTSDDRGNDREYGQEDNGSIGEIQSISDSGQEQPEMDSTQRNAENDGRRNDLSGDNLQIESPYDLGAGYLGNGLTVWDRNQYANQDYRTVAHISNEGEITFYDDNLAKDPVALDKVKKWAEEERQNFLAVQAERTEAEQKQREFLEENTIFPNEAEQIETARKTEESQGTEFLNREPINTEIDLTEIEKENKENEQTEEDTVLPDEGEIISLQGTDYYVSAVGEKTVTLQDVVSPLFTQELPKDLFIILLNKAKETQPEKEETVIQAEQRPEIPAEIAENKEPDNLTENSEKSENEPVSGVSEQPNKKGRKTYPQRQYDFFKKYAPQFMDGTLDYIRYESEGYEPLYIERVGENRIAIAHTYVQYGDLMLDPEVVFIVDDEKQEVRPFSFEQSSPPSYSLVYDYEDIKCENPNKGVERDIQQFFNMWSKNLTYQGHTPVKAVKHDFEKGDIEYKYVDGKFVPEAELSLNRQPDADEIRVYEFFEKYASAILKEEKELVQLNGENDARISIQDIGDGHIALYYTVKDENLFANTYEMDVHLNREANNVSVFMDGLIPSWFKQITDKEWTVHTPIENKVTEPVVGEMNEIHIASEGNISPEREVTLFDFAIPEDDPVFVPEPVKAAPQISNSERKNYSNPYLENGEEVNYGGPKARYANNVAAIKLLKVLEAENRLATKEEQEILAKYVGWGGIPEAFDENKWPNEYAELKGLLSKYEYNKARESTLTAFYTPPVVLEAIYDSLRNFGYSKGNILEPACGTGNFFGMLPEDMRESKLYGVELDSISGKIAQHLYPESNIAIQGFEETELPDNFFDVTIGNVPFGDFSLHDPKYNKYGFRIHDYFFAKGLDKIRPGGVMVYITSSGTMDKTNSNVRKYIAQRADLLGAIRLPNNTFKTNAGTEVTSDILFLKKRDKPRTDEPEWVYTENLDGTNQYVNTYFIEHPWMVLGELEEVSGPHGPQLTCTPFDNKSLRAQLKEAIEEIQGEYVSTVKSLDIDDVEEAETIPADPSVRNFSYTVVNDTVYFRENSIMHKVDKNATALKRIKGLIEVRDYLRALIDAQVEGASDEAILSLQTKLNTTYDNFVKEFGIINSRGNDMAFSDDSSYYLLCSLEKLDNENNFESKADIFFKRTIAPPRSVESVDTPEEALTVCIGERGFVDLDYICSLCNKSEENVIEALKGKIFLVPGTENDYEPSNIYLSGNVVEKLKEAKRYAEENPKFKENIAALEEVMPEPLGPADIEITFGSTWVPVKYYNEFMHELLEHSPGNHYRTLINISYNEVADAYAVSNKNYDYSILNTKTYGTRRINAYGIIENTLNGKEIKFFDVKTVDGKDKRVLNAADTYAARDKQQEIVAKFHDWIWKDPERSAELCRIYNEKFNCVVPTKFDGNTVIFHGMNPHIELRPYQKDAVARILQGGNTALAHSVGAGKTFTMIAGAMESKHLGLSNKAIIAVPNHLVGQWAAAIYELYPTANVLATTKKDFEKKNRKKFCAKIATGDYDIIVIGHSQFERIPISYERQKALLQDQIDTIMWAIDEEDGRSPSVKDLERTKKRLEVKLEKLIEAKKRDDVITFEELGVDRLFVDESHNFKNLFLFTKKSNVAGISQTDSQRASDMYLKCQYLDEITGNKGVVFATGTLISNTMAEVYTVQRYLQSETLREMGLNTFDKWASTFAQATSSLELAPEGTGYRERTRFSKFFNLPELMNILKMNVDIQTEEMLNLPLPEVKYENIVLEPSDEQIEYVKGLADRAERIRSGMVDRSEDNMLCVTNDGRKLALDQRLVDPTLPDNPNSKAVACADKIYELWLEGMDEKTTQAVFCDLSTPATKKTLNMMENENGEYEVEPEPFLSVYDDLKDKLMARGIPENEIKFIHDAKTDTQKENLFAQVRAGEVRVIMGSTGKMGTGTNIQDRLIAGHDIDCPWRPSDLEQRKGRVVRFGNQNDKVHMYRYVTEGTFDAYMYQLIESKQRMVSQILSGKTPLRSAADVDDMTLNYAEIKGLASGNPMIMEKVGLEIDIQRLKMVQNRYVNQHYELKQNVTKNWPQKLDEAQQRLVGLEKDNDRYLANPVKDEEDPVITIGGETFETLDLAGKAILSKLATLKDGEAKVIGKIQDFDIYIRQPERIVFNREPELFVKGSRAYSVDYKKTGYGTVNRLAGVLKSLPERLENCEKEIGNYKTLIADGALEMDKPFPKEEELNQKIERLKEIDFILSLDENKDNEEQDIEISDEKVSLSDRISDASERQKSQDYRNKGYTQPTYEY